jgi:hypothetical protein
MDVASDASQEYTKRPLVGVAADSVPLPGGMPENNAVLPPRVSGLELP